MPSIPVSEKTFRRIEDRAKPFEDTKPEDVIRRLLDQTESKRSEKNTGPKPADLVSKGGRIPHGSELRMTYKGKEYRAEVDDGRIYWNGQSYSSPSKAAVAVIRSTGSDRTTADGWRHWEVKTPGSDEWRLADDVRSGQSNGTSDDDPLEKVRQLPAEEKQALLKMLEEEIDEEERGR